MRHSKTPLFLMELVIMLLIFSVSAVICLKIFASARNISQDSRWMDAAAAEAQKAAEYWKESRGDLHKTAYRMGGKLQEDGFCVFYDEGWKTMSDVISDNVQDKAFRLELAANGAAARIVVYDGKEQILEICCEAVTYGG